MFIVVGLGDEPLLCCPRCAEITLELRVTGQGPEREEAPPDDQLSMF